MKIKTIRKIIRGIAKNVLRETQLEGLEFLAEGGQIERAHKENRMAVMKMPCGTGKTWELFLWAILFGTKAKSQLKKVLIVTFSKDVLQQFQEDYKTMVETFTAEYHRQNPKKSFEEAKHDLSRVFGSIGEISCTQDAREMNNMLEANMLIVANAHVFPETTFKKLMKDPQSQLQYIGGVAIDEVQHSSTNTITDALCKIRLMSRKPYLFGISATPNNRSDKRAIGGFQPEGQRNQLTQVAEIISIGSEVEAMRKGEIRQMMLAVLTQKTHTTLMIPESQRFLLMFASAVKCLVSISHYGQDIKSHRLMMVKVSSMDEAKEITQLINQQRYCRADGEPGSASMQNTINAVALDSSSRNKNEILHQLTEGRKYDIVVVVEMLTIGYSNSRLTVQCVLHPCTKPTSAYQLISRVNRPTGGRVETDNLDERYRERETGYIFCLDDNQILLDHFDNIEPVIDIDSLKSFWPRSKKQRKEDEDSNDQNTLDEDDSDEEDEEGDDSEEDDVAEDGDPAEEEDSEEDEEDNTSAEGKDDFADKNHFLDENSNSSDESIKEMEIGKDELESMSGSEDIAPVEELLESTQNNMMCLYKMRIPGNDIPRFELNLDVAELPANFQRYQISVKDIYCKTSRFLTKTRLAMLVDK